MQCGGCHRQQYRAVIDKKAEVLYSAGCCFSGIGDEE